MGGIQRKHVSPTSDQAQHYLDTVYDTVSHRLRAGQHPEDAMLTGWTLLQAWVSAHIDGCGCVFGRSCPDHANTRRAV